LGIMLRLAGFVKHVGCWVLINSNGPTNHYYLNFVQIRVPFFMGIFGH
jgi:hypothetical protein